MALFRAFWKIWPLEHGSFWCIINKIYLEDLRYYWISHFSSPNARNFGGCIQFDLSYCMGYLFTSGRNLKTGSWLFCHETDYISVKNFTMSHQKKIWSRLGYLPEYVNIYRSILNMIYWPIYESGILTDIWFFPKMIYWSIYVQIFHFLSDICKFLFSKFMHISVEISYKILIFSYIGQYNIISVDIWWHIPIIYVFIYRAL